MKFREIYRFEFLNQAGSLWTWLIFAAVVVISFLVARDLSMAEALYDDFFINSPFAIAKTTVVGTLLWLMAAAAVAGEAAARDRSTGMHPLVWSAPISKTEYLGGRFLAAFTLNALLLLGVQAGILIAVYLSGVEGGILGPVRPAGYLTAYAYISLPNAFAATAIQFALASRSGRPMAGYIGSLLLFFVAYFIAAFLLFNQGLGRLIDPIGIRFILEDLSHLWTSYEKNWRLLSLEGTILYNRLLWTGVGLATVCATWASFRFTERPGKRRWSFLSGWRRLRRREITAPSFIREREFPQDTVEVPRISRTFGFSFQLRQILAFARSSFRHLAGSWTGLALLVAIPLMSVLVVLDQMVSAGTPLIPATVLVLAELTGPLSAELSRWVIIPFFLVFFAGELVWRERDNGLGEITDAIPGSEWAPLLGKYLGLALVTILFLLLLMGAGMAAQALRGYYHFDIPLYLTVLLGLQLPEYLLFAWLILTVHVVVDQKYIGHLVAVVAYVVIAIAPMFGLEHNLLIYGAGPGWAYTEMRGFGASLGPWLWFKLYWFAWAMLLAVVARLLWKRGREEQFQVRLRGARSRLTRPTAWTAAAAGTLIVILGGYIFYNTNIRHDYLTVHETEERSAEYERRLGRYADVPQPRVTHASLAIDIWPKQRSAELRGTYRLVNRSGTAIDSIHVSTATDGDSDGITFGRSATRIFAYPEFGHQIFELKQPLQPGDSLDMNFTVRVRPNGFRESGVNLSIAENGTSFSDSWFPSIGYRESRELIQPTQRRAHGLPPRPVIPSLYDEQARGNRAPGITFEAVVSTDSSQIAVAPGELRRSWTDGDRRYFEYAAEEPIGNEWGFHSAEYAVRELQWEGGGPSVDVRLYHHPEHIANLDRMVRSIRASLDYYTLEFGAYPYRHLTVVERPGNGAGMHADAAMITFGEGFAYYEPKNGSYGHDQPYAVMAHEMAHQWTVPYASVEGAPVMSESAAWYSAMKVIEEDLGLPHLRRFLSWLRGPNRQEIRRGEPLLRGLDPYMSYRKGAFALYTLSEYAGEDRLNGALRNLLEKHEPEGAPLATTLDLYGELQAATPDSLHSLLHDLFEVNTWWELTAETATASRTDAGDWQVTLEVTARKVMADSTGAEREVPMDEWVEIGVFAPHGPGGHELDNVQYLQKHRIRTGEQTLTVTVPEQPSLAGIDPFHLLDLVEDFNDNNIVPVNADDGPQEGADEPQTPEVAS